MSSLIPVPGNRYKWNISDDLLDLFQDNDDSFTFETVKDDYSALAVQKINTQVKEDSSNSNEKKRLNASYGCEHFHSDWEPFENEDMLHLIQSIETPSLPAKNSGQEIVENGSTTKNPKKRLYSDLDSEELNNAKRTKLEPENSSYELSSSSQVNVDEDFSSNSGDDDDSSTSSDVLSADLGYIADLVEIEKTFPSNVTVYEHFYTTCELLNPPPEAYEVYDVLHPDRVTNDPLKLLNGKLIYHIIPADATEKLRENLKTAKKIIQFVHDAIPFSSNYLQRSKCISLFDKSTIGLIDGTVHRTWKAMNTQISPEITLEQNVRKPVFYKTGNCGDMSKTGLLLSYAKNPQPQNCTEMFDGGFDNVQHAPVEMYEISKPKGDHAFLVIDRDRRFGPSNYPFWGRDAVICDVWSGAHYPASEVEKYLMDYVGIVFINELPHPVVRHFNPSKETLKPWKPYTKIV